MSFDVILLQISQVSPTPQLPGLYHTTLRWWSSK